MEMLPIEFISIQKVLSPPNRITRNGYLDRTKFKEDMEEKGFSGCQGIIITRYVNEKNDIGMDEYVKELMGLEIVGSKKCWHFCFNQLFYKNL